MKVHIVIPNWNGADLISECLNSLLQQTYKATIVVVDNGSVDDSVSIIKNNYPSVKIIELPKNTGFAGGVNTGIRYALENQADTVALFNNDAVAEPEWLEKLVGSLADNLDVGITTGKFMLTDKKHIDSAGDYYSVWGMPFPRDRNKEDKGQLDKAEEVFGATGGASLYRAETLKGIGLFDERFFAYYEDVDISFRAQLAGWKVLYEPAAVAYHHLSATSSKLGSFTRYHSAKNFFILYAKNMPGLLFWKYLPLFATQAMRMIASSTLKGQLLPWLKGFFRFISYLPGIFKDRRDIQSNRKVSVQYIDNLLYRHRPPRIPDINSSAN